MSKYLLALIEVPDDVSVAEARSYIQSELQIAGKHRPIDDPLYGGLQTLKISSVRKPRTFKREVRRYPKPPPDIT